MSEELPELKDEIGFVKLTGEVRGHYSGCKVMQFRQVGGGPDIATQLNAYSDEHRDHMQVHTQSLPDGGLLVWYTRVLDKDELEVMQDRAAEISRLVEEKRRERAMQKHEAEKAEKAQKAETERLATVGKKCEQNHKKDKKG